MSDKQKFPLSIAEIVAKKIVDALSPFCQRIVVAGSVRRRKPMVGDIEILYVPEWIEVPDPCDMFGRTTRANAADVIIQQLTESGSIAPRKNSLGRETWGPSNKLAIACKTGIPVDFFETTNDVWFNYLVCRTGPSESNIAIAAAAQRQGYKWNPYGPGFTQTFIGTGEVKTFHMASERAVFEFVGLPYKEPHERNL